MSSLVCFLESACLTYSFSDFLGNRRGFSLLEKYNHNHPKGEKRSSSSKPCHNYVGVRSMDSLSPFQSIRGQIHRYVALIQISPTISIHVPFSPPLFLGAIDLYRETFSHRRWYWLALDMSKPF